jgi:hypothetical protein
MTKLDDVTRNDDDRFSVSGYSGVAFYVLRRDVEHRFIESLFVDDETGDEWWDVADDESETEEIETGNVVVVMVGDDREFVVDPDDLTLIADDEYCSGCGQIGCHAYG